MYNSQYYTCEQVDQRLLQGYLDDYNSENNTSLTKSQFLSLLATHLNSGLTTSNIVQQSGNNTNKLMSQAIVTQLLSNLQSQINTESNNRSEADQNINGNLSTLTNNLNTESNNRSEADQNLNTQIGYYECNSGASATKKEVSITGYILPSTSPFGGHFKVKMVNIHNSDTPATLSVNNTGGTNGIPIMYNGKPVTKSNTWDAGEIISVYYDGQYYQASDSQVSVKNINKYLYGDIRELNIGETYNINEVVKDDDGELLQTTTDVRSLTLDEEVGIGDLKVYNGNTYRAIKAVEAYNANKQGGYTDEECAIGAPAKLTLTIARELVDGSITVNFNGTNYTINTEATDTAATIANKILTELSNITGWVFSVSQNNIIATSTAHGSFSNTVFSITAGANTGVIGTKTVIRNGTSDSEEGAGDGTSTIIQLAVSVGVGTINFKLGSVEHDISITLEDTPTTIAEKIAQTSYEGWSLENTNEVITISALHAQAYTTSNIVLTDGILGISGVTSILFSGNSGNVCVYDEENSIWSIIQKLAYIENAFTSITIDELITYTRESSLHKLLLEEKRKLAYILGNHETRIKYYDENKMGSVEALVIAKALLDLKYNASGGGDSESSLSGTITPGNSDSIMIIGSSFGAVISTYVTPGKHWTQILDMFSDYIIQNVSADGSSNVDHLMWLRSGRELPYQNTRFALLVNSENLGGGVNVLYKSFVNLANAVRSFGIQPIIGTSHRNGNGFRQYHQYLSSQLRKWCKENNTLFMDAGEYTVASIKDGSGYSSHLNDRQSPTVAYAYMDALAGIEKPRQSLKLYKLRPGTPHTSLDELVFMDMYERARRFIPTPFSTTFTDYALISVILPATSNFLDTVILHLSSNYDINVYCLDSTASPYLTPGSTYTRFHVSEECSIQAGDKYSYNGTTFTVVHVVTDNPYGEFCDAYCSPALSAADSASGTLVKVSGSGSNTVNFHGFGIASMSEASTVLNDLGGHWVPVTNDGNDNYELSEKLTRVFYDQVYFLVECSGNFILNELYIKWKATREKTLIRTQLPDFTVNDFSDAPEIIQEPTFGIAGTTLTKWKDENNVAIVTVSASPTPPGCSSVVQVSNIHKMTISIPSSTVRNGRAVLEILARNNQETVTGTSWDWNKLFASLISDTVTTYDYPVGLAWRIIRIPVEIIGFANGFYNTNLTLYAEREGMEVAKVSLKYI